MNDHRPLETLAAFAICWAAGVLSTVALASYGRWLRYTKAGSNQPSSRGPAD